MDEALILWRATFGSFEDHWNHSFQVLRQTNRTENFSFVHKKTLFIGLNLVGGKVHDPVEWKTRLTDNANWMIELLKEYTGDTIKSVVLFGHTTPTEVNSDFFLPIRQYLVDHLPREVNILYMNGDAHVWRYEQAFLGQDNFLRIQLTGGTSEPPLKIVVDPSATHAVKAFRYDRRLDA
jgi:hypothetical protein